MLTQEQIQEKRRQKILARARASGQHSHQEQQEPQNKNQQGDVFDRYAQMKNCQKNEVVYQQIVEQAESNQQMQWVCFLSAAVLCIPSLVYICASSHNHSRFVFDSYKNIHLQKQQIGRSPGQNFAIC